MVSDEAVAIKTNFIGDDAIFDDGWSFMALMCDLSVSWIR